MVPASIHARKRKAKRGCTRVYKGWRMVNARLCETVRLAFFFASRRHFDFLDCETETSKCFECERETFRLLKFEPQIWFRAMRRYDNELELACTKVLRRRLLL